MTDQVNVRDLLAAIQARKQPALQQITAAVAKKFIDDPQLYHVIRIGDCAKELTSHDIESAARRAFVQGQVLVSVADDESRRSTGMCEVAVRVLTE